MLQWAFTYYFQIITSSWNLCLALDMKVLRHDQGSTLDGIHAHSHGHIISLWFNALYTLYATIFYFFPPHFLIIFWFSSPCNKGKTGGSEDDNKTLDDSHVPPVLSVVSVFEPSYSVFCLWSAAGSAEMFLSWCTDADILPLHRGILPPSGQTS